MGQASEPVEKTERIGLRTLPWRDDEMITVNGHKLIYHLDSTGSELQVRLFGGDTRSVAELKQNGCQVVMPMRLRHINYA